MLRRLLAASVFALTACGSAGGGGSSPAVVASPVPTTAPQSTAQVSLVVSGTQPTSAHGRAAHFVSPNATLFQSTVLSVNGSATLPTGTPATMTTAISPNGHDGTCGTFFPTSLLVCVVTVQAPTGYVAYQFDLFDKRGQRLSTANEALNMPGGPYQVGMLGIVTDVAMLSRVSLTYGEPVNDDFAVNAFDASSAFMPDPASYFQPFTVCNSDTSGHTTLRGLHTTTRPGFAQCVLFYDRVDHSATLSYDGAPIPPFTLVASGASIPSPVVRTIYPEPRIVLSGTAADGTNKSTLTFTASGQTKSFTASQAGHSGPFGFTLDSSCGAGASAIVSVTTADSITFSVTALRSGTCFATVAGLANSTEILTFAVP